MWVVFVYGRRRLLGASSDFETFDDAALWAMCVEKIGIEPGICPDCGGRVQGFRPEDVRATAVHKVGSEKWEIAARQLEAQHEKHHESN